MRSCHQQSGNRQTVTFSQETPELSLLRTPPKIDAPPRSQFDDAIARQAESILSQGLSPCLEFYTETHVTAHYDKRWTKWKQSMRDCKDSGQILREIAACRQAHPQCHIRLTALADTATSGEGYMQETWGPTPPMDKMQSATATVWSSGTSTWHKVPNS